MKDEAKLIEVAAGCLINPAGEVLIAQRPTGKIAAGQWEFPGGKIEAGESAREALLRELREEIGIEVRDARPLICVTHDYSDRRVRLDSWKITCWDGEPIGRESQALAWVTPQTIHDYPILAADAPIIAALDLPEHYVFTGAVMSSDAVRSGLAGLPPKALLRLRLPALDDAAYGALAARIVPAAKARGLRVLLDRSPAMAEALGADGWHASVAQLRALEVRPALPLCVSSAHGADDLQRARALGFDAAVLGTVNTSDSHPGAATLGFTQAAQLTRDANLPVYWIGGLRLADVLTVQQHYAQGIAAIRTYWP